MELMKDMPVSGPIASSSTHQDLETMSSRNSLFSSQKKGGLREGKKDLFQRVGSGVRKGCQLFHSAFAANFTGIEKDEAVTETGGIRDLVDGEKKRTAATGVGAEGCGDIACLAQVEAFEGFVNQQGGLLGEQAHRKQGTFTLAF